MGETTTSQLFRDFTFHNLAELDSFALPAQALASEPLRQAGSLFYNTADSSVYFSDGTAWIPLVGATTAAAGSDTWVQYNDTGALGASAAFRFDNATNLLSINDITINASDAISGVTSLVGASVGDLVLASPNDQIVLQAAGAGGGITLTTAGFGNADSITLVTDTSSGAEIVLTGPVITNRITSSTGDGVVSKNGRIHEITTNGANNLTLADGTLGQQLLVAYVAEGAPADTAVVTPANLAGGTTITFNNVGDTANLVFLSTSEWYMAGGSAVLA